MDSIYCVRFVRTDKQPDEMYFYNAKDEAVIHFDMFADDCSGLYQRIGVLKYDAQEEPELVKVF